MLTTKIIPGYYSRRSYFVGPKPHGFPEALQGIQALLLRSPLAPLWLPLAPFGVPLAPFWLPLVPFWHHRAHFWLPLAHFWLTFGVFWLTFIVSWSLFSYFYVFSSKMSCEIVFLHNFCSIFDFYVVLQPFSVRTLSGPGAELLPQATEIRPRAEGTLGVLRLGLVLHSILHFIFLEFILL